MGILLLVAIGYSVLQPSPGTYQLVAVESGFLRMDTRKGTTDFCQPRIAEDGAPVLACKPLPEAK